MTSLPARLSARAGLFLALVVAVLLSGGAGSAAATQADLPQLERELMNPCENCGGKPLAGSYCGGAAEAKAELRAMIAEGKSSEEIKAAFVAKYGEWILAVPERSGFNLFAWILPVVGIVIGGGGLALFLRRTNEARRAEPATQTAMPTAMPTPVEKGLGDGPDETGRAALRRRLEREVRES